MASGDWLGETITLNRLPFTVVGIAPPGFEGTFTLGQADFWAPMTMVDTFWTVYRDFFDDRRALFMFVYGRLAPGVTLEQARAQVAAVGQGLMETYPEINENRAFTIRPLSETAINPAQRDNFVRAGGLMMTVVGLILLIACVNVANLLLGKAVARRREIAIRMSLGAPRGRIVRQLLTESLVLGLGAGVLGLVFASWARSALWAMRPPFLQQSGLDLSLDVSVLAFTLGVALLTGMLFGLFPALRASRPALLTDLKEGAESEGGLARTFNFKNLLVTAQVALSLVALIGSGIFLRSLSEATRIDLGFEPAPLAMMSFDLSRQGYDADRGEQFLNRVVERANQVPGVESASLATIVPLTGGGFMRTVFVEGRDAEAENNGLLTPANVVGPGFFKTLGIELRSGREFTTADRAGSQPVAIVNQAMAERLLAGGRPDRPAFFLLRRGRRVGGHRRGRDQQVPKRRGGPASPGLRATTTGLQPGDHPGGAWRRRSLPKPLRPSYARSRVWIRRCRSPIRRPWPPPSARHCGRRAWRRSYSG